MDKLKNKISWENFTSPNYNVTYFLRCCRKFDKETKYYYERGIEYPLNGDMLLPEDIDYSYFSSDETDISSLDLFEYVNDIDKKIEKENMDKAYKDITFWK